MVHTSPEGQIVRIGLRQEMMRKKGRVPHDWRRPSPDSGRPPIDILQLAMLPTRWGQEADRPFGERSGHPLQYAPLKAAVSASVSVLLTLDVWPNLSQKPAR